MVTKVRRYNGYCRKCGTRNLEQIYERDDGRDWYGHQREEPSERFIQNGTNCIECTRREKEREAIKNNDTVTIAFKLVKNPRTCKQCPAYVNFNNDPEEFDYYSCIFNRFGMNVDMTGCCVKRPASCPLNKPNHTYKYKFKEKN